MEFPPLDFDRYHRETLPRALDAGRAALVTQAVHGLGSLAFRAASCRAGETMRPVTWHRDCGMGGHAVLCPVLIASVYLTKSSPGSGTLGMLPGSHRASFPRRRGAGCRFELSFGAAAQPR